LLLHAGDTEPEHTGSPRTRKSPDIVLLARTPDLLRREERRREPAVVCQRPAVVGSEQFGGHGHAADAAIATVAKRKATSTISGEQSDRQPSVGASRPTGS